MNVEVLLLKHAVWFDFEESANTNWSDWELFALIFQDLMRKN